MKSHSHWGPSDGLLHGPTFEQQIEAAPYNGNGSGSIFDWSHKPSAGFTPEALTPAVPFDKDDVRCKYKELEAEQHFQIASIKEIGQELIDLLNSLPESRELALAKVRVEEAVMWAVKAVSK
jgi:hypothetical protein